MENEASSFDADVRRQIYSVTLGRGLPPTIGELAHATRSPAQTVRESLDRLAAARVLILQPVSREILMAPPFSAVPTPFVARTAAHSSYANCAWDALGVSVMLHRAATIESACACCGEAITVATRMGSSPEGEAVVHFAVPARRWWDDIVYT